MLSHWLLDTDIFATPDSLSTFQKHIPLEWISNVLEQTDKASIRKRKLPAELVVWLIIAMGLFRDRSISDVVEKLDLTLTDTLGDTVAPSAIPQARQRLSSDPLQALFHLCAAHWTQKKMLMIRGMDSGYFLSMERNFVHLIHLLLLSTFTILSTVKTVIQNILLYAYAP